MDTELYEFVIKSQYDFFQNNKQKKFNILGIDKNTEDIQLDIINLNKHITDFYKIKGFKVINISVYDDDKVFKLFKKIDTGFYDDKKVLFLMNMVHQSFSVMQYCYSRYMQFDLQQIVDRCCEDIVYWGDYFLFYKDLGSISSVFQDGGLMQNNKSILNDKLEKILDIENESTKCPNCSIDCFNYCIMLKCAKCNKCVCKNCIKSQPIKKCIFCDTDYPSSYY